MITNADIVEIFQAKLPVGTRISIEEIHAIVEANCSLDSNDWAPHPSEVRRNRTYPAWKRKVQAVLHDLKVRKIIRHFEVSHEYMF